PVTSATRPSSAKLGTFTIPSSSQPPAISVLLVAAARRQTGRPLDRRRGLGHPADRSQDDLVVGIDAEDAPGTLVEPDRRRVLGVAIGRRAIVLDHLQPGAERRGARAEQLDEIARRRADT